MGATVAANFTFTPKVWQDHVDAYFRKKLVWGSLAAIDRTLSAAPGETVNFPYFKSIGAAQSPAEDESLDVDNISDDSFSCTVKEIGKAVGVKKNALRSSAARQESIFSQVQQQIGRVMAEQVDADVVTALNTNGNYVAGFDAVASTDLLTITVLNQALLTSFGDRADETVAVVMHSLQLLTLMNDPTAKFMVADATMPLFGVPGFRGQLLGMNIIVNDQCPKGSSLSGKSVYSAFALKANPVGICIAEEPLMEMDRDILAREWVFTGTQWYGVVGLHGKVSTQDLRVCRITTCTGITG